MATKNLQSAIVRLDLRTRLAITIAIEFAYMASSRVIYHYPGLTFAEIEMWRTPLRLFAALAFWLLMADVIFSRERNLRPLRRPLFVGGLALSFAIVASIDRPTLPLYDTVIICLATIPVGLHEELWFRGILQTLIVKRLGATRSIALMVPVFVAFHIGAAPLDFFNLVNIVMAGLLLGLIYERTGSLSAVVIIHALSDVVISIPAPFYFPVSWASLMSLMGVGLFAIWAIRARTGV